MAVLYGRQLLQRDKGRVVRPSVVTEESTMAVLYGRQLLQRNRQGPCCMAVSCYREIDKGRVVRPSVVTEELTMAVLYVRQLLQRNRQGPCWSRYRMTHVRWRHIARNFN